MILVTGGMGQIGSCLLLNLMKNKVYRVRAIYCSTQLLEKIRQLLVKHSDNGATQFDTVERIQADLSNIPTFEKAFEGVIFVFHCAGLISFQPQGFDRLIEVNVQGTANIVNLSIDFRVKKLYYVNSVATLSILLYIPIDEEDDWNNKDNNTDYAISKHGAGMEVWHGSQESLPVVIVNPPVVLGGDFADRDSGLLYRKVADGLHYYPAGAAGFVGVDDVVCAIVQLQFSEVEGERFALNAENLTYKAVLERIARQLGVKTPTKRVSHQMLRFLARLGGALSFLHLKKRTLTLASTDVLGTVATYNDEKIKKYIDFNYE